MNDYYRRIFASTKIIGGGADGYCHASVSGFPENTPALDVHANVRRLVSVVAVGMKEPGLTGFTLGLKGEARKWLGKVYPRLVLEDHHLIAPPGQTFGETFGITEITVESEGVADLVTFTGEINCVQLLCRRYIPEKFLVCRNGQGLSLRRSGLAGVRLEMKTASECFSEGGHGRFLEPENWQPFWKIVTLARTVFGIRQEKVVFPGMRMSNADRLDMGWGGPSPEWDEGDNDLIPLQNVCRLAAGLYRPRFTLYAKIDQFGRMRETGYYESNSLWESWFWKSDTHPYFRIQGVESSSREKLAAERELGEWLAAGGLGFTNLVESLPEKSRRRFLRLHRKNLCA